jgi:tape measure domain-containing protein
MPRSNEEVQIVVTAKDEATRTLGNVSQAVSGLSAPVAGLTSTMGGLGATMATLGGAAVAAGVAAIGGAFAVGAAQGIAFNAALETTTVAFTTMLGSAEEAGAFLEDLQQFAARTPFEFPELANSAQLMLAMGFAADDVLPLMEDIGNAVSALGGGAAEVDRVTRALGQMQAKGKVSAEDMMQLTELGIPAWKILADSVGVTVGEVQEMTTTGLIPADKMIQAFTKHSEEAFGGAMQKQSETFSGMWSSIQDNINLALGAMSGPLFDAAKAAMGDLLAIVSSPKFIEFAQRIGRGLGQALAFLIPKIRYVADAFITFGQAISGSWEDAAEGISPFHRLIGQLGLALRGIFQGFETGGIEGAIGVLLLKLEQAVPQIIETLGTWAGAFLDWIGPMIPPLLERLGGILVDVLSWIGRHVPSIAQALLEWGIAFSQWIGERIPIILEELGKLLGSLRTWMSDHEDEIEAELLKWATAFGDWVMNEAWPYLQEELAKLLIELSVWILDNADDIAVDTIAWGASMIDGIIDGVEANWWRFVAYLGSKIREIDILRLLTGSAAPSGQGGGTGPFTVAPMGLAAAGAGVVSGVTVPSFHMVPRRPIGDVPNRGVIVAPPVVINVDARGAADPLAVERAGYRGARRALEEAGRQRIGRRSVQRFRQALERRARIR